MSTVLASQPRPGITLLTMNRPERLNAMSYDLVADLHAALDAVADDASCRAVVLTGAGRGFCAGLDLKDFVRPPGEVVEGRPQAGMRAQQHIAYFRGRF